MGSSRHRCQLVLGVLAVLAVLALGDESLSFPAGFLLGTATASYQVEGAWNLSGKGENIWDHLVHTQPHFVDEKHNGDVACDSYHKFKEDVQLVKAMGMDVYRFSLSWSRLLPTGGIEQINQDGVRYYRELIEECHQQGLKPMVTLYHWDLPQPLQDIGGWPNDYLADFFEDYAEFAFKTFGDRVTSWITFNEPFVSCAEGYGLGEMAPALNSDRRADYMCAHTVLKAHARAYRLYQQQFKAKQGGVVGIALNTFHFEPKDPKSAADREAAETLQQFWLGWFAHPIFSREGGYPAVMKDRIAAASRSEGLRRSRLPQFTDQEVSMIRGSSDFLGLNHYTSRLVSAITVPNDEGRSKDHMAATSMDPSWNKTTADWFRVVPWGFRKVLLWIRDHYDNPPVFVTENGFPDTGELHDMGRVRFFESYLRELLGAISEDRCDVRAYIAWSLLDNFEWARGYTHKYGLIQVDFHDPERRRTPKLSFRYWKLIAASRKLPAPAEVAKLLDSEGPDRLHIEL